MSPPRLPAAPLFPSVEEAWFWASAAIAARHRNVPPPGPGPCLPETVTRCLDDLYRTRRIVLLHARVLRDYGQRGRAPDPRRPFERCDWRLWREAMEGLEGKLRRRGLLAPLPGQIGCPVGGTRATGPGGGAPAGSGSTIASSRLRV